MKSFAPALYACLFAVTGGTPHAHRDTHSVLLDYDIFEHVPMLDAKDVKTVQKLYDAKDLDFRLKPAPPRWTVAR